MRFEDLLETKEAKQIYLIKQLLLAGGQMNVHQMREILSLSKKSIDQYIEDLQSTFQDYPCHLEYDGVDISFSKTPEFAWDTFERKVYSDSLYFRILWYLLEEKEINRIQLSQQLSISESSLSRKISELNQILKEFELRIWHGKIVGEEIQIRYFYFQLLWYLKKGHTDVTPEETKFIGNIERGLKLNFTTNAKERLILWLRISKKRMSVPDKKFEQLEEKFVPYLNDPWFNKMRPLIRRFYSFYAVEITEGEVMLHFIFLVGMSVLSEEDFSHYALERTRLSPTSWCDTVILENLLKMYEPQRIRKELEATSFYHLSQIHIRLYFFKGAIEVYDRDNIWQLEEELSPRDIQSNAKELLQIACKELDIKPKREDSLVAMSTIKYLSVLAILDVQVNQEVKVGIHVRANHLFEEVVTSMFALQLMGVNGVICQKYVAGQEYDLVLTNMDVNIDHPVYRITELGSSYDLQEIKKIIRSF